MYSHPEMGRYAVNCASAPRAHLKICTNSEEKTAHRRSAQVKNLRRCQALCQYLFALKTGDTAVQRRRREFSGDWLNGARQNWASQSAQRRGRKCQNSTARPTLLSSLR